MDLDAWVRVFDRLLPNSPAWSLVPSSKLRRFVHGLMASQKLTMDYLASVLLEMMPQHTSYLHDWSQQFGSVEDFTADELEAAWSQFGGQHPRYLQDILQALVPTVYVHECWDHSTSPPTLRNPMPYVDNSIVLVNDLTMIQPDWRHQFGDGTQFGDGAQFGESTGYRLQIKQYPCPDDPDEYPVYWYVCGETWPDYAEIPSNMLRKLIRLIFKIKPMQTRVILRVSPIGDPVYDYIQDVIAITDPTYQDSSDPEDDPLQDR